MSLSACSACLWSLASHCNMAIVVALETLGHYALTMEKFAYFEFVVVEEAFLNQNICLLYCPNINQQWPVQFTCFSHFLLPCQLK